MLAALVLAGALAVGVKVATTYSGFAVIDSIKPADVSAADTIDPLAEAAGLTVTRERHDEGSVNENASWTKNYNSVTGSTPSCVAVLQAATTLRYTIAPTLGVTAENCVAESQKTFGAGGTIVTTPAGQDISVLWTLDPGTVTMSVDGPQPS